MSTKNTNTVSDLIFTYGELTAAAARASDANDEGAQQAYREAGKVLLAFLERNVVYKTGF